MEFPSELFYTQTHEWAKREQKDTLAGITAHAQGELRDVVFIELPKVGRAVKQAEPVAVVESVKAAFDIYAPVSGTITRVNEALVQQPQWVNEDCYGKGWMFAIAPSDPKDFEKLMTADAYIKKVKTEAHS